LNIDEIFKTFDADNSGEIEIAEFAELISRLGEDREKFEIDCFFRHCDARGVGKVSNEDFKKAIFHT
jgi:Ca2+-binding EF-hand superfamily protein